MICCQSTHYWIAEDQASEQATSQEQSLADDSSSEDDDEDMAFPDTQVAQPADDSKWDKYNLQALGDDEEANEHELASSPGTDSVRYFLVNWSVFHPLYS